VTDILITRRAKADFKSIWLHIAEDNEAAADNLLLAVDEKIEQLREFPELGTRRDDIRSGARMLVHGNYLVLYEYDRERDAVTIVTVVHGARDLGSLL
jgi:toxin ParE1/3/4